MSRLALRGGYAPSFEAIVNSQKASGVADVDLTSAVRLLKFV